MIMIPSGQLPAEQMQMQMAPLGAVQYVQMVQVPQQVQPHIQYVAVPQMPQGGMQPQLMQINGQTVQVVPQQAMPSVQLQQIPQMNQVCQPCPPAQMQFQVLPQAPMPPAENAAMPGPKKPGPKKPVLDRNESSGSGITLASRNTTFSAKSTHSPTSAAAAMLWMQQTRPCKHNAWESVRMIRKRITLRCRVCQALWKLSYPRSVWHCPAFLGGDHEQCPRGESCPLVHLYHKKQGLFERLRRMLPDEERGRGDDDPDFGDVEDATYPGGYRIRAQERLGACPANIAAQAEE
eukprot:TRINITY_DN8250_c0_g2_i1.p1 TRINITY_DN8250_c0_g2~~TRINITY_DN8250_c0_g2_i1.p1  ORF type:complete len:292 (+),score=48.46 TRINITY_DN8250_c0_g2_i1:53-928(+)